MKFFCERTWSCWVFWRIPHGVLKDQVKVSYESFWLKSFLEKQWTICPERVPDVLTLQTFLVSTRLHSGPKFMLTKLSQSQDSCRAVPLPSSGDNCQQKVIKVSLHPTVFAKPASPSCSSPSPNGSSFVVSKIQIGIRRLYLSYFLYLQRCIFLLRN